MEGKYLFRGGGGEISISAEELTIITPIRLDRIPGGEEEAP